MLPLILKYDGSWRGLLSLVFYSFEFKCQVKAILNGMHAAEQVDLFIETRLVITQEDKAARVCRAIVDKVGKDTLNDLYQVFLSELPACELKILQAIQYYFKQNNNARNNYGSAEVLHIKQIVRSVSRERHRMKAFIRFQKLANGIFYAVMEPDFNVLPLILKHFKDRYQDQEWIIYDRKRHYGAYYNLDRVEEISFLDDAFIPENVQALWHHEQQDYDKLWKTYFESVNIKERKNTKLHVQEVPKRYWKYLNEKKLW